MFSVSVVLLDKILQSETLFVALAHCSLSFQETMITLLYHLQSLRWIVPAVFMLGTASTYYIVWGGFRLITSVMPSRVFQVGDDMMYSLYQRLILFFFEYYTGVEVCWHLLHMPSSSRSGYRAGKMDSVSSYRSVSGGHAKSPELIKYIVAHVPFGFFMQRCHVFYLSVLIITENYRYRKLTENLSNN